MRRWIFGMVLGLGMMGFGMNGMAVVEAQPPGQKVGVSPDVAADYIHAVIQANRRIYAETIVDRLEKTETLQATENWKDEGSLPLPAQFLSMSAKMSNERGVGMRYRLMSLWPINPENSPKTKIEKTGFQEVVNRPDQPFTWLVQMAGIWYFQAVYPDIASTESCIHCHNGHPDSPRHDFKLGDVMGGILINLPLGRRVQKTEDQDFLIPPEVVTDYVHSVLESDRTVYSKHVVDRLQKEGVIQASEFWWMENGLPLPAQFLLNASRLVRKKQMGLDFRLISQWPINPLNGPANEFERLGLESVAIHPVRPYIGQTRVGQKRYFQAIYPDIAVAESCVLCHNQHPDSPKHDFQLDDVMGGIVVTLEVQELEDGR
ncbi:MAG: DUF3365 domain-containing protein [Nitrospinaceae bacterium]|nr:DUF3365 domain-containing protein [Nitrospinaceae bacterium]NIR57515.1 DUF3365 domain-containing protein [Nitrospinaceae bacterium]NIS87985.1 DUF3365 domain-containing protein [Nitrospinaceae bacterium]NIT84849.1 DUF3365 domain-containing protein [Nitrospinaceae bacterium]NIU47030.1 DUF3365 domain-containing protein [Nitrospinaceae bacterium]